MIDRLSLATLDSAVNDYESAASVREELSTFLGEPLSESELFSVFRSLESLGLVEAYCAAPDNQALVPVPSSASDQPAAVWFIATSEGHRLVEREWESTFGTTGAQQ